MQAGRITTHRDPVHHHGLPPLLNGILHHIAIGGIVKRDHGLDAGISEVL